MDLKELRHRDLVAKRFVSRSVDVDSLEEAEDDMGCSQAVEPVRVVALHPCLNPLLEVNDSQHLIYPRNFHLHIYATVVIFSIQLFPRV